MARRRLEVEIVGDASKLDRAFKQAERSTQRFGRRFSGKAGGGFGGLLMAGGKGGAIGAAIAIGGAVAVKTLSSVVAKAKEAEVAQANLSQAMAAAGVSTAVYGRQVDKAIQSTSKLAAIDDELVSDSYASLLRTTGSVAKATRGVALAANIARARKISLAAATKVVEKAENGQLRGLRALGVEIDKNTTAQQAIERAQRKFAGSAERYGRTAAGAQEKYSVALENVQERIGAKLLPLQTKLALAAVRFLDWSDKNWPRFAKAVEDVYRRVKPAIDATVGQIKGVANVIAGTVRTINALAHGDWSKAWDGMKQVAVDGVLGIVKAVASLPAKIAKSIGSAAFDSIQRAFTAALNKIIGVIRAALKIYNSIPLVPDVKLPGYIGQAAPSRNTIPARPDEGSRGLQVAQPVQIVLDGRVLGEAVISYSNKSAKRTAGQSRGRTSGNPMHAY